MTSLSAKEYHELEAAKRKEEKVDTVIIESIIHLSFLESLLLLQMKSSQKKSSAAALEAEKFQGKVEVQSFFCLL